MSGSVTRLPSVNHQPPSSTPPKLSVTRKQAAQKSAWFGTASGSPSAFSALHVQASFIGVPLHVLEHLSRAAARLAGQRRAQRGPQVLAFAATDGAAAAPSLCLLVLCLVSVCSKLRDEVPSVSAQALRLELPRQPLHQALLKVNACP